MKIAKLANKLNKALKKSDDLRRHPWHGSANYLAGHCYIASEVSKSILGNQWLSCFLYHEGQPHWFLKNKITNKIFDPTADQFDTKPDYKIAVGKGFLTKDLSKRSKVLLSRINL